MSRSVGATNGSAASGSSIFGRFTFIVHFMDTVLQILPGLSTPAILARVATTPGKSAEAVVRRSRGRPLVPVEKIVATALQIVDEQGADALSMRTLAQRMDSGTATLYRHFANRAELVAQVIDLVYGSVEVDIERLRAMSWQEAIKAAAQAMFDSLREHANVAPLFVDQFPVGPNAMVARQRPRRAIPGRRRNSADWTMTCFPRRPPSPGTSPCRWETSLNSGWT